MRSKVLYIDDALELPARTASVLEPVGFELVHAGDPDEALRRLCDEPPALVLIEVLLETCDGFALIERIASDPKLADLPIVVVTRGERSPELYGRSLELGVREFLCKPVLEAQVLGAVLEFARQPPGAAERPNGTPPAQAPEAGDLAAHPVPELFAQLHRTGATGVLRLRGGAEVRSVQFRNGSPVAVSAPRPRETFEAYALRTGWIKRDEYETALDHEMAGICDARAALEAIGALTASQAEQVVGEQARDALLDVFRCGAGAYDFHPRERIAAAESLEVACDPTAIVLEGVRRTCPDAVVRAALEAQAESCVFAGPELDGALEIAGTPQAQRAKLAALAGERTLAEELAAGAIDPRLLYGLVVLGAVELDDTPVLVLTDALDAAPALPAAEPLAPAASRAAAPAPARAPAPATGDVADWLEALTERVKRHDDFELFGIEAGTGDAEVQRVYRELIASFPPIPPELDDLAGRVRARIDRAYGRVKTQELRAAFASLRRKGAAPRAPEPDGARAVDAERHFRKGQERLAAGDPVGAVEALGLAVHLDPDQGDYVAHLGYALYRSKPGSDVIRREALEHIAKGVKLAPDQVTPLLFLGRVFRETGDPASAAKVFRKALALRPDHHEALEELCLVQMDAPQRRKKGLLGRLRGR